MSTPILVTGGAGYVGSHACKLLHARGYHPVVFDNLSRGHRGATRWGTFVEADLADKESIKAVLLEHRISQVLHFAAYAYVAESVRQPRQYYRNNVANTLNLLEAMVEVAHDWGVRVATHSMGGEAVRRAVEAGRGRPSPATAGSLGGA